MFLTCFLFFQGDPFGASFRGEKKPRETIHVEISVPLAFGSLKVPRAVASSLKATAQDGSLGVSHAGVRESQQF